MIRNTRGTMLLRSARRDPVIRCQRPGPTRSPQGLRSREPESRSLLTRLLTPALSQGTRLADPEGRRDPRPVSVAVSFIFVQGSPPMTMYELKQADRPRRTPVDGHP